MSRLQKITLSWQIVPTVLSELLQMRKIDIKALQQAAARR